MIVDVKKVLFGITSLTLGGAERVLVDMVNKLSDTFDITIFTIYGKGELEEDLNENIKIKRIFNNTYKELTKLQKMIIPLKILLFQKKFYQKYIQGDYDVEVAFLEGPITRLFSTKNVKTKKIAWIHNDISKVYGNSIKAKIKQIIDRTIYNKYQKLIFVSQDNKKVFDIRYPNMKPSETVIYNYIDSEKVIKKSEEKIDFKFDHEQMNFLTVARLVEQKGIDRLIRIHRELIANHYANKFYIIGDGPERQKLENIIKEEKLQKTFFLLGAKENPYPYMKQADMFCLLSKFEGYGMVLEEAKILNKPIIITNTAAREAVENYKNAIIVENEEHEIYNKLKYVIENHLKVIQDEKQTYDNQHIIKELENLLKEE